MKIPPIKWKTVFSQVVTPMLIFCGIWIGALILLFTYQLFQMDSYASVPAGKWVYASGIRPRITQISGEDWNVADVSHPISAAPGHQYLYIRGSMPANTDGTLVLHAANAVYRISVDRKVQLDELKTDGIVPSAYTKISLCPSERNYFIEIIAFIPFSRNVTLLFCDRNVSTDLGADLWLSALFGVVAVVLFYLLRKKNDGYQLFKTLPVSCLLAIPLILLPRFSSSPQIFRIQLFCLFCLYWQFELNLNLYLMQISETYNKFENLFAVNMLYLALLLAPYQEFSLQLVKFGAGLQAVNLIVLYGRYRRYRAYVAPLLIPVMVSMTGVITLFWFRIGMGDLRNAYALCACLTLVSSLYGGLLVRHSMWISTGAENKRITKSGVQLTEEEQLFAAIHEQLEKIGINAGSSTKTVNIAGVICPYLAGYANVQKAVRHLLMEKKQGQHWHAVHVSEYSHIICDSMGMDFDRGTDISDAAVLHDIGKIAIPSELLKKKDLTDDEFNIIKKHNQFGYKILTGSRDPFLNLAATVAREHHEYVDGSGYLGLNGNEISLAARIVTVADVFDALTGYRAYKKSWTFEDAFTYILDHGGTFFDSDVVKSFENARKEIRFAYDKFQRVQKDLMPETEHREE